MTKFMAFNFLISEFFTLGKFQCILFLNIWFDGGLFVNFYIDIWVIVLHSICMTNVTLSFQKFIMNSFYKYNYSIFKSTIFIKIYCNMDN
jgi:hypothetical protein